MRCPYEAFGGTWEPGQERGEGEAAEVVAGVAAEVGGHLAGPGLPDYRAPDRRVERTIGHLMRVPSGATVAGRPRPRHVRAPTARRAPPGSTFKLVVAA